MNGEEPSNPKDNFSYTQLFSVQIIHEYFAYIIQYLRTGTVPQEYNTVHKKNLIVWVVDY
jgi:hypothetical protein